MNVEEAGEYLSKHNDNKSKIEEIVEYLKDIGSDN